MFSFLGRLWINVGDNTHHEASGDSHEFIFGDAIVAFVFFVPLPITRLDRFHVLLQATAEIDV